MKIAIYGYGNLGRGVELASKRAEDAELFGVFTRRDPVTVRPVYESTKVFKAEDAEKYKDQIDVMIICGGSATDLPVTTPKLAQMFNVVDSFDTHRKIPDHFEKVNDAAEKGNKLALISGGWDPGLFSLARLYASSVLNNGQPYTFWGKGISQGHSDAIRRIEGVKDARQYTIPVEDALEKVRNGENPVLTAREKHRRECFVVAKEGYDKKIIEQKIKSMPNYFEDYDTTVHFITEEELKKNHSEFPHGGNVIYSGKTGINDCHTQTVEFSLSLESNPEFTSSVLLACARAVNRMKNRGRTGCITLFDVAPADLNILSPEEIRKIFL